MAYYISQGLNLKMGDMEVGVATYVTEYFGKHEEFNSIFPNLQEIGEISLSGSAAGGYDQIEVTTLADTRHVYTNGLIADSDSSSNEITFKFLYDPELFKLFKDMMSAEELADKDAKKSEWIVSIPEGGTFTIAGDIASLAMDSISTNSALAFTLTVAVDKITVA